MSMETGLLEKILTRRYGYPIMTTRRGLNARCWNPDDFDYASALYLGMKWESRLGTRFASLKPIYGEAFGGFLIKNLFRVAMLLPRKIYGVWSMDDFQMLSPVRKVRGKGSGLVSCSPVNKVVQRQREESSQEARPDPNRVHLLRN